MAKAKKQIRDDAPNPNSVANKDVMQRLNFLYQAGVYLNSFAPSTVHHSSSSELPPSGPTPSSDSLTSTSKRPDYNYKKNDSKRLEMTSTGLSRVYVDDIKTIGRKTVVKLDPSMKRTICKQCRTILIPGCTATVRVKSSSSHSHAVTYSCIQCKTSRRIPAPPVLKLDANGLLLEDDRTIDTEALPHAEKSQVHGRTHTRRSKSAQVAHRLPLFQRPGHIVFSGNERVINDSEDAPV